MADADKIAAKFKLADRDGTGLLDRKAVARLFKSIGQTVGKKELDRMVSWAGWKKNERREKKENFLLTNCCARKMQAADSNGDGKIDLKEFQSILSSSAKHAEQDLRESFTLFDTNADGFIDAAELKAAMKNFYAVDLTDADVAEMIAEADTDGNKKIDFTEFKQMMEAMQ
jgi:Ca2+-binding EF-hand superfamily protein